MSECLDLFRSFGAGAGSARRRIDRQGQSYLRPPAKVRNVDPSDAHVRLDNDGSGTGSLWSMVAAVHLTIGGAFLLFFGVFFVTIGREQTRRAAQWEERAKTHFPSTTRERTQYARATGTALSSRLYRLTGYVFVLVGLGLVIAGIVS